MSQYISEDEEITGQVIDTPGQGVTRIGEKRPP